VPSATVPLARADGGAGAPTVERLLTAAERLIAEQGVDAVSVRAVNAAAGANVAAVHYHFGSKEALVDAVLERRMAELTRWRASRLDAIETDPRPTVRAVVEALVVPIADFGADPRGDGRTYVRFLAALDVAGDAWRLRMGEAFAPQYERVATALARAAPEIPTPVLEFRLGLAGTTILATLADPARAWRPWARAGRALDAEGLVAALVDHVTGSLAAPVDPRSNPRARPAPAVPRSGGSR
jgi:AcrR family transcriptional regulator